MASGMLSKNKYFFLYTVLIALAFLIYRDYQIQDQQTAMIPYSEFQSLLKEGKVSSLIISDQLLQGDFVEPRSDNKKKFITTRVEETLAKDLSNYPITYSRVYENHVWSNILSWVLPLAFFIFVWFYIIRKATEKGGGLGGGFLTIGKNKAKVYIETEIKTRFTDIAGVDEAIEELKETVNFLKDPQSYGRLGARMPKGVLLVGPPGTGKTLLAKAIAGEAGVPFFSISGSEFVEMFVGVGAARVRDLFEQARQKAPCIIFIDELDALGRARSISPLSGGHDEKEQTLNQLLAELDGFDTKIGVILLAATNRPEILDPALLRAGRFDRQILVDRPDKKGRTEILKVHTKKVILENKINLEEIAALTPGFTGADIENLVNEAAIIATRKKAEKISATDFTAAIERIVAGLERKNRLLNPKERRTVAYHEMGHAIVSSKIPGADKINKISIIPRGIGSLGYTIQQPTEDRYLMTREELIHKMTILMGGRSAEKIVFGCLSTGAVDDIQRATDIARNIVTKYGMVEKLGPVAYEKDSGGFLGLSTYTMEPKKFSEDTSREIDCAVKDLIQQSEKKALEILEQNRSTLDSGAELLLQKETLVEADLTKLLSSNSNIM